MDDHNLSESQRLKIRAFDAYQKYETALDMIEVREMAHRILTNITDETPEPDATIMRGLASDCEAIYNEWAEGEGKDWAEAIASGEVTVSETRRRTSTGRKLYADEYLDEMKQRTIVGKLRVMMPLTFERADFNEFIEVLSLYDDDNIEAIKKLCEDVKRRRKKKKQKVIA